MKGDLDSDQFVALWKSDPCKGLIDSVIPPGSAYGSVRPRDNRYKSDGLIFITVNNGMRAELVFTQCYKL